MDPTPHLCDTMHDATVINHPNCLKRLLEQGPLNVNDRDVYGCTRLHYASRFGCVECINILLDNDADINEKSDQGFTALHYASESGDNERIRILINRGAHINEKRHNGWTALHLATYHNFTDCIVTLLYNGADMDDKTDMGQTIFDLGNEQTKIFVKEYFVDPIKESTELASNNKTCIR
jgi:serine/threonine-protein phosphatase 6 regulatory ankyrin repeat subunit B